MLANPFFSSLVLKTTKAKRTERAHPAIIKNIRKMPTDSPALVEIGSIRNIASVVKRLSMRKRYVRQVVIFV